MKKVLVVGCDGQDGRLLIESLLRDGCSYYGIGRQRSVTNIAGEATEIVPIGDRAAVRRILARLRPDEVYYLAAFHHSSEEKVADIVDLFRQSYETNLLGLVHFLEAIRLEWPATRLFYASSSHIFGAGENGARLDEKTPFNPRNVYGMSKLSGLLACRYYREEYGIFAAAGILFNHESRYRPSRFLSKRIARGALEIKRGGAKELVLGDLSATADWGYAPDYVEAMRAILALPEAEDFVVATGEPHTVLDFAQRAFSALGLDGQRWTREDRGRLPKSSLTRIGNPQKLMQRTGWRPSVDFEGMVRALLFFEEGAARE